MHLLKLDASLGAGPWTIPALSMVYVVTSHEVQAHFLNNANFLHDLHKRETWSNLSLTQYQTPARTKFPNPEQTQPQKIAKPCDPTPHTALNWAKCIVVATCRWPWAGRPMKETSRAHTHTLVLCMVVFLILVWPPSCHASPTRAWRISEIDADVVALAFVRGRWRLHHCGQPRPSRATVSRGFFGGVAVHNTGRHRSRFWFPLFRSVHISHERSTCFSTCRHVCGLLETGENRLGETTRRS